MPLHPGNTVFIRSERGPLANIPPAAQRDDGDRYYADDVFVEYINVSSVAWQPTSSGGGGGGDITAAGGDVVGTLPILTIANGRVGNAQAKASDPFAADKIANPPAGTPINAFGGAAPAFTSGWAVLLGRSVTFELDEITGRVWLGGAAVFAGDPPAASIMFTLPSTHWPYQKIEERIEVIHNGVEVTALLNVSDVTGDVWVGGNFNTNCNVYLEGTSFRVAGA